MAGDQRISKSGSSPLEALSHSGVTLRVPSWEGAWGSAVQSFSDVNAETYFPKVPGAQPSCREGGPAPKGRSWSLAPSLPCQRCRCQEQEDQEQWQEQERRSSRSSMLTRWPSGEGDGLLIHCALHAWVRIPSSSVSPRWSVFLRVSSPMCAPRQAFVLR